MTTTINADNGVSSGSAGLKQSADSSGVLALQTNGTTALSISTSQVVTFTNPPIGVGSFATGTAMLFQQTSPPTGWTKQTTHNDKTLRVVSGTASSGGTTAFSTVFANQTPTITTSGLSAGATTLDTTQIPSHTHTYNNYNTGSNTGTAGAARANTPLGTTYTTNATGGGGSHTHSISGSATSSAITLNVQYVDLIIATKD